MGLFQTIANWIKGLPVWLKRFLDMVWDILWGVMQAVSKTAFDSLKDYIIAVAQENISNEEKFGKVWDYARKDLLITIKDSALRLLIESIVSLLKNRNQI